MATARAPTAPIAIFRKKLESGLNDSLGIIHGFFFLALMGAGFTDARPLSGRPK